MGCSNEKILDDDNKESKGYPVCRLTIPLATEIYTINCFQRGKLILGGKNELLLFEESNKSITTIGKEHKGRINSLITLSNGQVASGGQDNTIKIWDINKKAVLSTLTGHTSIIWQVYEMENNKLITASDDNSSRIFDLKTKQSENFCKLTRYVSSVAVVKNNKVIIASGKNIFLYDLKTKKQESVLDINVWYLKVLANGDVACGLGNGLLYIITVTDELIIKTKFPRGHKRTINFIIELDNHKIVTSSDENDLILWDPNDPESMFLIKGHTDIVTGLCLISGKKFASSSKDKTLKIWE